ncbi:MAG: YbaB/EbfC family nucleoid-associated protein [Oscillospiraceae bacterium]|jgi:DNA-binding YbaB/EbfC family protein|nr:YbaB/EbfC family nucleoid-associated protein [Oscillospiraceae bacterium]
MAKHGGFPGGGIPGGNMQALMKQAQKMQQQMLDKQEELDARTYEATAGGGAVNVTVSGKRELVSIKIKPEAVDPEDVEMLEDLIIAAVNEALRQGEAARENEMNKIGGGMRNMGGLF